jgi:hypothetical protein
VRTLADVLKEAQSLSINMDISRIDVMYADVVGGTDNSPYAPTAPSSWIPSERFHTTLLEDVLDEENDKTIIRFFFFIDDD